MSDRERQLERALKNLIAIFDSPEWLGTETMANVHGYSVDPDISLRNGSWIDEARKLVPLGGVGDTER